MRRAGSVVREQLRDDFEHRLAASQRIERQPSPCTPLVGRAGVYCRPVATTAGGSIRDSYNAFIERHEVAWELTFAGFAIVYVVIGFAPDTLQTLALDYVLTAVFFIEFTTRIGASYDRRRYFRGHWIDLVALVPPARGLRVLRLLRLLRLIRAFAGMYRALAATRDLAQHKGLAVLITAWAGVMVICSLAMYAAENGVNEAVSSPFDAMWWGIVTLTTVGYGDVVPKTPEGRLAATVLMLLGIGAFSAITAIGTSFLLRSASTSDARSPADRLRDLAALFSDGLISADEYDERRAAILREL